LAHSITLAPDQRAALLRYYRGSSDPHLRLRAHILLLLDDGRPWQDIAGMLYCSTRTIARWKERFQRHGLPGLRGQPCGTRPRLPASWVSVVVTWVLQATPRAFGFLRSRWCCEVLALLLWRQYQVAVSRETLRRGLHRANIVWRRPRPVLRRQDPERAAKLQRLRELLLHLPDDETVVFQDEVDINLNPKIGCMWMRRGQQAEVVTPGDNAKRYLAGSLHWRTGVLITTEGSKRDGALFVAHLHELRRRLQRYKVIHVICDNAKFHHDCGAVWEFCYQYGERVQLHFLPKYAPELNPIERVWWRLHEAITRNHQCQNLEELVDQVLAWLTERKTFPVQDEAYLSEHVGDQRKAA
jgi:putative transposase